jgi:hypothetical protein
MLNNGTLRQVTSVSSLEVGVSKAGQEHGSKKANVKEYRDLL